MSTTLSAGQKAVAAWGQPLPDWVAALARACDDEGLRKVAGKMRVSPALVSLALNKKRGKFEHIKGCIERTLMTNIVPCPVLGVIEKNECLEEQARPFSAANPLRVQLYGACRGGCRHYINTKTKGKEHVV